MSLEDLKKKIYQPEEGFENRIRRPKRFKEKTTKDSLGKWSAVKKKLVWLTNKQKKYLYFVVVFSAILILAGAVVAVWYGFNSFDKNDVEVAVFGPEKITAGEEVNFVVKYWNKTRLDLEEVRLALHYPEGSFVSGKEVQIREMSLSDLPAGQQGEKSFSFRVTGLERENKKVWAELVYQPEGISARYSNKAEFKTLISSVPLALSFNLPDKLVNDQEFGFILNYSNQGDFVFKNLDLKIEYPSGFEFISSDPSMAKEDSSWFIGDLDKQEEGRILIKGKIFGDPEENKPFKMWIGRKQGNKFVAYSEIVKSLKISSSPLFISQELTSSKDNIVGSGERMSYNIHYKNTSDFGVRDVVIRSKLEGIAYDIITLSTDGSYDEEAGEIIWNAANVSELEYLDPKEEGSVSFSVNVKRPLPISSYNDKNFTLKNTVEIDSSKPPQALEDIQIKGISELVTKVATDFEVSSRGYYEHDILSGTGPIPPQKGKTTNYTIEWTLLNTSNALSDVKVESFLPPHVNWTGEIVPANADLRYNSDSGNLVWHVGGLSPAIGVLSPAKKVIFRISITPTTAQIGDTVELIGSSYAEAEDNFTEEEISSKSKAIYSNLPDDPTVGSGDGSVVR